MKKVIAWSLGAATLVASHQGYAATAAVSARTLSSIEKNAADVATNSAAVITLGTITVTPGPTGYNDGDIVRVSFSGGTIRASSLGVTGATPSVILCKQGGTTVMTLSLTTVTGSGGVYTVARNAPGTLPSLTTCTVGLTNTATGAVSNVDVLKSSLLARTDVTFNWTAETAAGSVYDILRQGEGNLAQSLTVAVAATQFALNLSSANTSRVNSGGYGWVRSARGYTVTGTTLTVTGRENAAIAETTTGVATLAATFNVRGTSTTASNSRINALPVGADNYVSTAGSNLTMTYRGDFSFLDNNQNGCSSTDLTNGQARVAAARTGAGNGAPTLSISTDCSTLTTTGTVANTETAVAETLTFTVGNYNTQDVDPCNGVTGPCFADSTSSQRPIAPQTIAVTGTLALSDGTSVVRTGSQTWSANAFSVQIPYMPYGSGISRIIYITNRSSEAQMRFSAVNEAGVSCAESNFPALTAPSGRTTSAAAAVDAGIAACYGAGYTGKVVLSVIARGVAPQLGDTVLGGVVRPYTKTLNDGASAIASSTLIGTADTSGVANNDGFTALSGTQGATNGVGPAALAAGTTGAGGSQGAVGAAAYMISDDTVLSRRTSAIDVYSAYNVNGNRVQVINPSNGR